MTNHEHRILIAFVAAAVAFFFAMAAFADGSDSSKGLGGVKTHASHGSSRFGGNVQVVDGYCTFCGGDSANGPVNTGGGSYGGGTQTSAANGNQNSLGGGGLY